MRANLEGVQNLTATLSAVSTLAFTLQEYAVMHCILTPVSQPKMEATLSAVEGLSASLTGTGNLTGYLTIPPYVSGATYEGPYSVQPKWHDQVLNTANKVMTDDVEVASIYVNSVETLARITKTEISDYELCENKLGERGRTANQRQKSQQD